ISGKWLLDKKSRLTIFGGNRRDVEQMGASLTSSTDVLGRSLASSAVIVTGANNRLTNVNLTNFGMSFEPLRNFEVRLDGSFRKLSSASPSFSLDYNDITAPTGVSLELSQFESRLSLGYYPKRQMTGFGVERKNKNDNFARLFAQLSRGDRNWFTSDFDYTKMQLSYIQPWQIGGFGRLTTSIELGKTFGEVPLALLSVVPGNQTYFSIYNSFSQLDFYEFVTDTYTSVHLEHNFNGRVFSRIPFLKKYNLRAILGLRGVWGELSEANSALSTTGSLVEFPLVAPDTRMYYEYSVGVANIFKVLRLDFNFRGNYLDNPGARQFGVTGSFGFYF
ncbi:DUF5686 family protein, partial [Winogradskyella sp.]|nr:DUF5686 family protein [Winogradskyella sp.]